jgi:hypothetical protein
MNFFGLGFRIEIRILYVWDLNKYLLMLGVETRIFYV